jgi:hypothetical protein
MLMFVGFKSDKCKNAIVIRDSTGTYLRINDRDYKVCNLENLSKVKNGRYVRITYRKTNECIEKNNACYTVHPHEGMIEVMKIKLVPEKREYRNSY